MRPPVIIRQEAIIEDGVRPRDHPTTYRGLLNSVCLRAQNIFLHRRRFRVICFNCHMTLFPFGAHPDWIRLDTYHCITNNAVNHRCPGCKRPILRVAEAERCHRCIDFFLTNGKLFGHHINSMLSDTTVHRAA